MGEVYHSSPCNIAATGSGSSEGGLFVSREPSLVEPCLIIAKWTGLPKNANTLLNGEFWFSNKVNTPPNRRAWVVQERLLAP